ncbi:helix-turn-helix transcriptional regulator [Longimycelium tulufanense]|uniref:Helix-turn-helix transcriptional regulator n=1 Tax=Longimycelium tulufanense TaxID=907463 RepID=A0A8J3C7Q9_9PSEU|nr:response regulator transcription factor [Longimycelium tulufanense]GGM51228.1 helix-turn-helix transcriptional regulator [Longimycelium tulufanense]
MQEGDTVTVAVAVHAFDPVSHAGLTALLRDRPGIRLVPRSDVRAAQVIVIITDRVGAEVLMRMRDIARQGCARLVLVADHVTEQELFSAVECGLAGLVPRAESTGPRLVAAILAARSGHGQLPGDLLGVLLRQVRHQPQRLAASRGLGLSRLEPREVDTLRLLAEGFNTADIAAKLAYSERTVKNVIHRILHRHGLHNRPNAVAWAVREGLI